VFRSYGERRRGAGILLGTFAGRGGKNDRIVMLKLGDAGFLEPRPDRRDGTQVSVDTLPVAMRVRRLMFVLMVAGTRRTGSTVLQVRVTGWMHVRERRRNAGQRQCHRQQHGRRPVEHGLS